MAGASPEPDKKTLGHWSAQNRRTKNVDPSPMTKKGQFSGFEERKTPRATFRPQTTDPSDIFEAVIHIHWVYPDEKRVGRGLISMSKSNVYRRVSWFLSAC